MINKRWRFYTLLLVSLMMSVQHAQAQNGISVGIKAGTTGYGAEVSYALVEKINARVTGSIFSYTHDGSYAEDDVTIGYDVSGNTTSIGGVFDYFPFRRGLKLSAGVYYHDFLIEGSASPTDSYTMGDKEFPPEKLGSLSGKFDYESKLVPYAGFGFGNPIKGSRLKLNFELGALYTNSPQLAMHGEGMIAPTADQGQDFEDGLADFKLYPVLNLSLSFRITNN